MAHLTAISACYSVWVRMLVDFWRSVRFLCAIYAGVDCCRACHACNLSCRACFLKFSFLQALPAVLRSGMRLASLDISDNNCIVSFEEMAWLSVSMRKIGSNAAGGFQVCAWSRSAKPVDVQIRLLSHQQVAIGRLLPFNHRWLLILNASSATHHGAASATPLAWCSHSSKVSCTTAYHMCRCPTVSTEFLSDQLFIAWDWLVASYLGVQMRMLSAAPTTLLGLCNSMRQPMAHLAASTRHTGSCRR